MTFLHRSRSGLWIGTDSKCCFGRGQLLKCWNHVGNRVSFENSRSKFLFVFRRSGIVGQISLRAIDYVDSVGVSLANLDLRRANCALSIDVGLPSGCMLGIVFLKFACAIHA